MLLHGFYGRHPVLPVLCLLFVLSLACAGPDDSLDPNEPPTIWLSGGPPEGSVNTYEVQLFWGGWDPDGEIAYYEYCITDNDEGSFNPSDTTGGDSWSRVYRNDSTFLFSANTPADEDVEKQVTEFRRSHTFFIRSVDTEGTSSRRPAYRSFTSRTLSPKVVITQPLKKGLDPSKVPPISTFKWIATDYDDSDEEVLEPDSVSWILEPLVDHNYDWLATIDWIRNLPVESPEWGQWKWYGAPGDSNKFWTTEPIPPEMYVFAIRVLDEAGAIWLQANRRESAEIAHTARLAELGGWIGRRRSDLRRTGFGGCGKLQSSSSC